MECQQQWHCEKKTNERNECVWERESEQTWCIHLHTHTNDVTPTYQMIDLYRKKWIAINQISDYFIRIENRGKKFIKLFFVSSLWLIILWITVFLLLRGDHFHKWFSGIAFIFGRNCSSVCAKALYQLLHHLMLFNKRAHSTNPK